MTDDLSSTVRGLRTSAADLRLLADALRRAADGVRWEGLAGDAVRAAAARRAACLETGALACESAARGVARVEAGVERLADAATSAAEGVVEGVVSGAGEVAAWLD